MDYEVSEDKIKRAREYIELKKKGMNKHDALIAMGFSESTAKSPSIVENTKAYQVAVEQILNKNKASMGILSSSIEQKLADEQLLDKMSVHEVAQLHKVLADIHKIMTPQVTIKEEQMKDGTTKRTVWGQGSVQGNTTEE